MADPIEQALEELRQRLSRLEPKARQELLDEAANHLEDLRAAHRGDAEAAVREFGDPRTLSIQMLRACGPRRSRALAALTFIAPMVLVAGMVANGYHVPFEFSWFVPPYLLVFAIIAWRTRRFAWREMGAASLAAGLTTWVFLASATIDLGEKDGMGLLFAPTAASALERQRNVIANGTSWLSKLEQMERAYGRGDPRALASLTTSSGYLVPSEPNAPDPLAMKSSDLPTVRIQDLEEAKEQWRTRGKLMLISTQVSTQAAESWSTEFPEALPTLADRFGPQLVGYLPTALQVAALTFALGAGIHLLMLALRLVAEAAWRRLRPSVAI
ncbi:MAG: hypothetical protein M9921_06155 [Fimbriimonadaceae bacterium]|nr:hypothetical protein [Fimbriimonadaceae bacterium]